jgi:putative ABC transport system ATP-binding protein
MIRLDHLTREYEVGGKPLRALDGVTETIEEGEHVAIMGPSGSGKSTLLNILGCLDRPTGGSYRLDGREVSRLGVAELSEIRRHKIGFIFQAYHLVGRLDASGNVELPMTFAGIPRSERRRRAAEALDAVGLADRKHHRPDQLSGGERQRVAIARAISMRPRILLADEPTGNLDSAAGHQVLEILERMNEEGLTLLVVTHDPAVARRAERVVFLRDGRIVRRVAAHELSRHLGLLGNGEENGGEEDGETEATS